MFDLAKPKFIIQDGELRMGRVVMHKDLASEDGSKPVGGGFWYFDMDVKIMYLYGKSHDFGEVKVEDFEDIWLRPSLEDMTIYFSTESDLELAKQNNVIIQNLNEDEILH